MPLILGNALSSTEVYVRESVAPQAHAQEAETIEEKITRIADKWGISYEHLYNLSFSESSLGEARVGDGGKSCGIVHFHQDYYPEEFSKCDDDEYILNRAAEMISKGEGWKFTPCNCYAFAKVLVDYNLPKMIEIVPNEVVPRIGSIAIFRYKNEKHIAVIERVVEEGIWIKEANFKPCSLGKRLITFDDPALKGFYRP